MTITTIKMDFRKVSLIYLIIGYIILASMTALCNGSNKPASSLQTNKLISTAPSNNYHDHGGGGSGYSSPDKSDQEQGNQSRSVTQLRGRREAELEEPSNSSSAAKKDIYLLGLFPFSGSWPGGLGQLPAVMMGLEDVNSDPSILPGYTIHMTVNNTQVRRRRDSLVSMASAH